MLGIWQQRLLPLSQYTVPLLWNSLLRKNNLYKLKCRQAVDNSLFQYDSYTPIRLLLNCFKYIPNNGMWDDQNWIPTCFMVSSNPHEGFCFSECSAWPSGTCLQRPTSQPSKPVNRTPSTWLSRALHKSTRGCGQMLSKVCHRWELKISQIRAATKWSSTLATCLGIPALSITSPHDPTPHHVVIS